MQGLSAQVLEPQHLPGQAGYMVHWRVPGLYRHAPVRWMVKEECKGQHNLMASNCNSLSKTTVLNYSQLLFINYCNGYICFTTEVRNLSNGLLSISIILLLLLFCLSVRLHSIKWESYQQKSTPQQFLFEWSQ